MIEDEVIPLPNVGKPNNNKSPLGSCHISLDQPENKNFDPTMYITPQGAPLAMVPMDQIEREVCGVWDDDAEDVYLSQVSGQDLFT